MSVPEMLWRRGAAVCLGLLALSVALCLGMVSGYSLNLIITSAMAVALVAPAFGCYSRGLADTALMAIASALGVLTGWVIVGHGNRVDGVALMPCAAVLTALIWAQVSICRWLCRWRVEPVFASGFVAVLSLTWLAWPLWATTAPPLCVRLHPLLAMNGVVSEGFGMWTEQPIAYPWIALGQDVSYQLPRSPWACVMGHLAFGLAATALVPWWRRNRATAIPSERR